MGRRSILSLETRSKFSRTPTQHWNFSICSARICKYLKNLNVEDPSQQGFHLRKSVHLRHVYLSTLPDRWPKIPIKHLLIHSFKTMPPEPQQSCIRTKLLDRYVSFGAIGMNVIYKARGPLTVVEESPPVLSASIKSSEKDFRLVGVDPCWCSAWLLQESGMASNAYLHAGFQYLRITSVLSGMPDFGWMARWCRRAVTFHAHRRELTWINWINFVSSF